MYLLCGSFCFTIYLWTGALKVYKNNLFLFSRGGDCCWWVFYFKYYSETIFFNTTGKRETIPTQWPSKYIFTWGALSCLSKRTNFNSVLRAQIYMMQSLFHRIQPAQAHVHGFTCQYWHVQTNTCSPFVTNINFFLLSLHILRELRYGPKWCCSVYITPGWGLIKEFSYEV